MTQYGFASVAAALKRALKKKGLSYADLSERVGMSESGLKKIMSGDDVSLTRLADLCAAAGIDLADLLQVAWRAPPPPYLFTAEQAAFFADHPAHYNFLSALMHWDMDTEAVMRDHDLDQRSMVRYLGDLEDIGLVTVGVDGRIQCAIPAPYRTGRPPGVGNDNMLMFLRLALEEEREGRRVVMAGLKMTAEHFDAFKRAIHDVVLEYGVLARQDELTVRDDELVEMAVLTAFAPCRHSEYVPIPRIAAERRRRL